MRYILDKFSKQSVAYKKFRPTYPSSLFEHINSLCLTKETAWDCGTGNGQVALELAKNFDKVHATDVSEKQIQQADSKKNIIYSVSRAEKTSFEDNTFDLVTAAQAVHWFDIEAFNQEAKRVLKPNGILAVWGYGLLKIEHRIDKLIDYFYTKVVGDYWDNERRHIDNNYQSIELDFQEIPLSRGFEIKTRWTLKQLEGYLNSWSSVQNYIEANEENPVDEFIKGIAELWDSETKDIHFPIFLRIGKNIK